MVSRAILNGWPLVPPCKQQGVPAFTVLPSILGSFYVGSTVRLNLGVLSAFPAATVTVQWLRDTGYIFGATASTYVLTNADLGAVISAEVRVSNAFGWFSFTAVGAIVLNDGGAFQYALVPAPVGYRWDFVTENGNRVTENNQPVVDLVRSA